MNQEAIILIVNAAILSFLYLAVILIIADIITSLIFLLIFGYNPRSKYIDAFDFNGIPQRVVIKHIESISVNEANEDFFTIEVSSNVYFVEINRGSCLCFGINKKRLSRLKTKQSTIKG